jgi:hypothetical protein
MKYDCRNSWVSIDVSVPTKVVEQKNSFYLQMTQT